jgi:hypothetical protein
MIGAFQIAIVVQVWLRLAANATGRTADTFAHDEGNFFPARRQL